MSHEIKGAVSVLGNKVEVVYKKMFGAPLELESCTHQIKDTKNMKGEKWFRAFHGAKNGKTKVRMICTKNGEITLDYSG